MLISGRNSEKSQVVDGQQRLTTLTILFSTLRDLIPEDMEYAEDAIKTIDSYVIAPKESQRPGATGAPILSVQNTKNQNDYFQEYVQKLGATKSASVKGVEKSLSKSSSLYLENITTFQKLLSDFNGQQLYDLAVFISERCYLVVIEVDSEDQARHIFQVLNARGMPLRATDILKAKFLQNAGTQSEKLALAWEDAEEDLGRDQFELLFTHIDMMRSKTKRKGALEKRFVIGFPELESKPKKFLDETLRPVVEIYRNIDTPSCHHDYFGSEATHYIRSLNLVDNKNWLPPLFAYLLKFGTADKEKLTEFLYQLERHTYSLFVRRLYGNHRINRAASFLKAIDAAKTHEALMENDVFLMTTSEKDEFKEALDVDLYGTKPCLPLLLKLNATMTNDGILHEKKPTVEHVLPRTLKSDNYPDWSEEDHDEWVHHISNLVLLERGKNTAASNKSFDDKKKGYFDEKGGKTTYALTQDVLEEEEWTVEVLVKRKEKIMKKFSDIWQLD